MRFPSPVRVMVAVILATCATAAHRASADDKSRSDPSRFVRARPATGRGQPGSIGGTSRARSAVNDKHDRVRGMAAARARGRNVPLEAMGSQQRQALETRDLLTLANHLYQASGEDAQVISKIIMGNAPEDDPYWQKFGPVVDERAALYQKLTSGAPAAEFPEETRKALLGDAEYARLDLQVREFEATNQQRFVERIKQIEENLPQETVEMARRHWDERVRSIPGQVQTFGLLHAFAEVAEAKIPDDIVMGRDPVVAGDDQSAERARAAAQRAAAARPRPVTATAAKPVERPVVARPATPATAARPQAVKAEPPKPVARPEAKPPAQPAPALPAARPLSEWEKYVLEFIEKNELSESQRNSAMSILKDLTVRAQQVEQANKDRVAAAQGIADARARKQKLDELNAPIDRLFHELKKRLDSLLTAAQRAKAKAAEPAANPRR